MVFVGRVVRVIDHVDTVFEREPHRLVGPGVGADVHPGLPRHLDRRRHFGVEIGDLLGLARMGELVARDIELDVVHAFTNADAAGLADLVRPVGDVAHRFVMHVELPLVAEPAGGDDLGRGRLEPRSGIASGVDHVPQHRLDAELVVADARGREEARETLIEHLLRVLQREHHMLFRRKPPDLGQARAVGVADVGMGLDEAGHQGRAGTVHHRRAVGPDLAFALGDLLDEIALEQNLARIGALGLAVEDRHVFEECLCHRWGLPPLISCPWQGAV